MGKAKLKRTLAIVNEPLSFKFSQLSKLNALLDVSIMALNKIVFDFLKTTEYPLSDADDFPLLDNEDVLVRDDIFRILRESGVGVPKYYEKVAFEVNGKKGEYARSRSGCFFCFFQQKLNGFGYTNNTQISSSWQWNMRKMAIPGYRTNV